MNVMPQSMTCPPLPSLCPEREPKGNNHKGLFIQICNLKTQRSCR